MDEKLKDSIKRVIENWKKEAETKTSSYFGGDEYRLGYAMGYREGIFVLSKDILATIEE